MISIAPDTHLLESIRHHLIDNALPGARGAKLTGDLVIGTCSG